MGNKYVRTNYGIYALKKKLKHDIDVYVFVNEKDKVIKRYYNVTIIKEADTIEELCDEFIIKTRLGYQVYQSLVQLYAFNYISKIKDYEIFGAIWTDKGLIYVAKLNDKGELEVLENGK